METFIKLYDWMSAIPAEERIVYALVVQFSEHGGAGFWGGYHSMSERTGIPKSRCRSLTAHLVSIGAVTESRNKRNEKTRIFLTANPDFIRELQNSALARDIER